MEKEKHWLTVSEIANICQISRQTLIYYDKHDIFKPQHTDSKGYRYYTVFQIPYLREICALKDNNLSLKDIADNFHGRNIKNTQDLLKYKKQSIEEEIDNLKSKLKSIDDRLDYFEYAKKEMEHAYRPYVRQFPERKILYSPWGEENFDRATMHLTHMKLRNQVTDFHEKVDRGWGALFRKDSVNTDSPLAGAGAYINLPPDFENKYGIPDKSFLVIPAGFFACICKYRMPYETEDVKDLCTWASENHYTVTGDILDECLLDTTFYTEQRKKDFCQIQIPIQLPGISI